ncbi:FUSC family protein [Streptomyces fuscigenes]|uniref:FUSC family protein n=1 Tax=Streptomyces fuscigenes TaxID=1528880 RepID=UPI001F33748A|nr:FUSC family protein [Streptomyces fuscigenes]MCF3962926.1 FUSC family protein [Streptomyces fuscigenes]
MAATQGASGRARTRLWDRFSASDPGLIRLMAALRTVGAIVLTLGVLAMMGTPVIHLVAGAMGAMVATFAVREKEQHKQAVTLLLGLLMSLVSVSLGALLGHLIVLSDLVFLALIFGAVYARRFGDRGYTIGLFGFQFYFVSLFVHATPSALPQLWLTLAIAFACSAVARFVLVRQTTPGILGRLRTAFRARLAQLVAIQIEMFDAPPEDLEKVLVNLRRHTARLHEAALMIQGRLGDNAEDPEAAARADVLQRRIAGAEIAAERLGWLLLNARSAERADTLTLHLPNAPVPAQPATGGIGADTTQILRRDLRALHLLVTRLGPEHRGTAQTRLRNRLLGYRDEENLPSGPPAVQDVFRGIGEAARAVLGLRLALDGPGDESDDTAEATRSREEFEAEEVSAGSAVEAEETGLKRRSTRAAFQVSAGSVLAMTGGEFLSDQRWYWAVLTCWVVFLNTSSTGEILVKGYRRLIGTVCGVVSGVVLAGLVGNHTWTAFALVLVCIFGMFFTAPLSYAMMSFFVTSMLGLLYTLLHTYSIAVLVLRIEETALGAACGVIAALVVLPIQTDRRTDQLLRTVLLRLGDVAAAAVTQLSGGPTADLLDMARDLDTALDDLRRSVQPLTHPFTPLRERRQTARYLVALLESCAYHARSLAATAELVPYSKRVAADPRLARAGDRIAHNIAVLAARVTDERAGGEAESGASIASMLEETDPAALRSGTVTFRVLRHLQRLDEGVIGLARPLDVPLASPEERRARTTAA